MLPRACGVGRWPQASSHLQLDGGLGPWRTGCAGAAAAGRWRRGVAVVQVGGGASCPRPQPRGLACFQQARKGVRPTRWGHPHLLAAACPGHQSARRAFTDALWPGSRCPGSVSRPGLDDQAQQRFAVQAVAQAVGGAGNGEGCTLRCGQRTKANCPLRWPGQLLGRAQITSIGRAPPLPSTRTL